jgi:hypothetical protein
MSEMSDELYEKVREIAESINEDCAGAKCEPDVGYWPANTFESASVVFQNEVAEAFPGEEFDEDELMDIFSEIWTGVI